MARRRMDGRQTKTGAYALLALLLAAAWLQEAECSLPLEVTGEAAPWRNVSGHHPDAIWSGVATGHRGDLRRLPGLCRRLRRRRFNYLCHKATFCWEGRRQGWGQVGQVCQCPRGSTCSRVFIRSI